jgi:glycosyltransferase involved in cell wall biosynthesis
VTLPRVLFLDQAGVLGGAELSLLDIAAHFAATGRVVLLSDGPLKAALVVRGIDVIVEQAGENVTGVRRDAGVWRSMRGFVHLLNVTRRLLPLARASDLLYANSQKAFVLATCLGLACRRPVIWHLRDMLTADHFSPINRRAVIGLARLSRCRVIANSHATREAFIAAGGRGEQCVTIHNGIDPTLFETIDEAVINEHRAELGLGEEATLVGSFSRLSPWKGQHVLLDAAAGLPGLHVALIGDALFGEDDYAATIRRRAGEPDLAGRVHLLGFRDDVPAWLKACDVVAHTSTAAEPFGRVVVEAMLARRPVVATAAGGILEIIEHNRTGLLVPPGDTTAMRDALQRLMHDRSLRHRLADAGYAEAHTRFTLDPVLQQVERVVCEVAGLGDHTKPKPAVEPARKQEPAV